MVMTNCLGRTLGPVGPTDDQEQSDILEVDTIPYRDIALYYCIFVNSTESLSLRIRCIIFTQAILNSHYGLYLSACTWDQTQVFFCFNDSKLQTMSQYMEPRWQSGNTLASHLLRPGFDSRHGLRWESW